MLTRRKPPSKPASSARRWATLIAGAVTIAAATILIVALGAPALTTGGSSSPDGCPEIILYFSRGSGQAIGPTETRGDPLGLANPGLQLYQALAAQYGSANVASIANGYPAVAISWRLVRTSRVYGPSVAAGRRSLKRNLADLARLCPRSQLILGGFSQGAEVTHSALPELGEQERRHIVAVALFGDPLFAAAEQNVQAEQSREGAVSFDSGLRGIRYLLAKPQPIASAYADRVFSWCHGFDIVCQGLRIRSRFKTHKTYADEIPTAIATIGQRLRTVGIVPEASPALYTYRIVNTCHGGTCGLAEWSGPGTASFSAVGSLYDGQSVSITCQAMGENVTGADGGSSAVWDRLTDGAFVSDYYIDTPNYGVYSPAIPRCRALAVGGA
jgi:hypothetical protein